MVFKIRTLSLPTPRTKEDLLVIHGCPLKTFSLRELKLATDSFSKKNIVDRGGFGCVYRGRLVDGSLVAIKRLKKERTPGGELHFQTEVDIGGSSASNHRNVLRLCGYCMTRKERILVYPFIVNRCVSSWLWGQDPAEPPLDWSTRKRIALGTAKGLAHLHYGSSFTVIHRDIKPANILLDEQFQAILCDFGLAKFVGRNGNESNSAWVQRPREEYYHDEDLFGEEDESDQENNCLTKSCWNFTRAEDGESRSRVHTRWSCWVFTKNEVESENGLCGTMGYMDPDYFRTNQCSVKSDVYGYGVTLLELVTGQRVLDSARLENDGHVPLRDWVKGLLEEHKLDLLVDSNIRGDCIEEELEQLIHLALSCTDCDPKKRPVMTVVIKIIENIGNDLSLETLSFQRLKKATHDFSNKNTMGKSGYGYVYKGLLQDGSAVYQELELGATTDLPQLDTEGSISTEFSQTSEVTKSSIHLHASLKQESSASSKLKPQSKGITISDNVREPNMQERYKTFLSEVVSDALPTHSKLFRVDPLCPLCNEYEEDNLHLFFKCDFARQAWLLAVGLRIDMLGFESLKEAVDAILKPSDGGFGILPCGAEPSLLSCKGVALMHAIWSHRNQVCFNNVSPNVIQMLRDHPDATHLYGTEPPPIPAQSTNESPTQTQEQFEARETGWATFDTHEPRVLEEEPEVLQEVNCVQCESNHEAEPARVQPRAVFLPAVGIKNSPRHDFQFNITTSGGFSLSLKCSNLFVCCVILLIPIFVNTLVYMGVWDKAWY